MEKGHVLKFVVNGKTFDENVGIRTFPRQTYGVSQESPDEFKQKHTLIGEHGYLYRYENAPEFEYPSQKKYFDIHNCVEEGDHGTLHLKLMENSVVFHRKKGRLSEFMDKNGWMSPVTPIMGFERGQQARLFSNRDRERRISSLKPKIQYENKEAKKPLVNPEYFSTISSLMSEKLRIRKRRNDLAGKQGPAQPKTIPELHVNAIQAEHVSVQMAKTSTDFYSTQSTFYKRGSSTMERRIQSSKSGKQTSESPSKRSALSPEKSSRLSPSKASRVSPSKVSRSPDRVYDIAPEIAAGPNENPDQKLQEWYRTTCSSRWAYNPKKLDSEEREEEYRRQTSFKF